MLKDFFEVYKGKLIFHNISFDATVLIYQLWMKYITDTEGLLKGLSVMLNNFDDTTLASITATIFVIKPPKYGITVVSEANTPRSNQFGCPIK